LKKAAIGSGVPKRIEKQRHKADLKLSRSTSHRVATSRGPMVAIACPSTKLLDDLKDTKTVLDSFGIRSEITIVAAHRSPRKTLRYIQQLETHGVDVVIAAGSGSAHLPGMIASLTVIPVIGIPLHSNFQYGIDSLLSMIQMPQGVPVGTMGINSSYNAGIFACQVLSLKYPYLKKKLRVYKRNLEQEVETEDLKMKQGNDTL
jgi:5-(carboxyamino)imidazole ribonucleotide mutase